LLEFRGCSDFVIDDLNFDGRRDSRSFDVHPDCQPPSDGFEPDDSACVPPENNGFNLILYACQDFRLEHLLSKDAPMDGIYIGRRDGDVEHSRNGRVIDCSTSNCARHGLTIADCLGLVVDGGVYAGCNGLRGSSGLHIEPHWSAGGAPPRQMVRRCVIRNVRFHDNAFAGLTIGGNGGSGDILIDGCFFTGTGRRAILTTADRVRISRCTFTCTSVGGRPLIRHWRPVWPSQHPLDDVRSSTLGPTVEECFFASSNPEGKVLHATGDHVSFRNNVVLGRGPACVHIFASRGFSVSGNKFDGTGSATQPTPGGRAYDPVNVGMLFIEGGEGRVVQNHWDVDASTYCLVPPRSTGGVS
jgi:hypothetical protein